MFYKQAFELNTSKLNSQKSLYNIARTMITVLTAFSMLKTVESRTCFESAAGHDYTLGCGRNNEANIVSILYAECGVYNDSSYDNCANYFIDTLHFCKGIFNDPVCALSYHSIADPDPCIVNVVQNNCENDVVTDADILIIVSIALASLCVLTCCIGCFLNRSAKPSDEIPLTSDVDAEQPPSDNITNEIDSAGPDLVVDEVATTALDQP